MFPRAGYIRALPVARYPDVRTRGRPVPSVILSGAKDLRTTQREILRSAQDDNRA